MNERISYLVYYVFEHLLFMTACVCGNLELRGGGSFIIPDLHNFEEPIGVFT